MLRDLQSHSTFFPGLAPDLVLQFESALLQGPHTRDPHMGPSEAVAAIQTLLELIRSCKGIYSGQDNKCANV